MNLETLAQDVAAKKQDRLYKHIALSEAELALSDAETTLSDALCDVNGPNRDEVAIVLKYDVVICTWDGGAREYTTNFVSKVPNANT